MIDILSVIYVCIYSDNMCVGIHMLLCVHVCTCVCVYVCIGVYFWWYVSWNSRRAPSLWHILRCLYHKGYTQWNIVGTQLPAISIYCTQYYIPPFIFIFLSRLFYTFVYTSSIYYISYIVVRLNVIVLLWNFHITYVLTKWHSMSSYTQNICLEGFTSDWYSLDVLNWIFSNIRRFSCKIINSTIIFDKWILKSKHRENQYFMCSHKRTRNTKYYNGRF